jgi:hypothetical protein
VKLDGSRSEDFAPCGKELDDFESPPQPASAKTVTESAIQRSTRHRLRPAGR